MSRFRQLVEKILMLSESSLIESEQKINWLLSQPKVVDKLATRLKTDQNAPKNITPEELLKHFDTSSKYISKFLPWAIKLYTNNAFDYTDLPLINNYLENFTKNSYKLEKKDINTYKSLDELRAALNSIKDIKGSKEQKRAIKAEAEKIYEDNNWLIIIPHTEEAAIQYGKGTTWCTASTTAENMFKYYDAEGPLYIIINKHNPAEKYQFHFESGQFRDPANDRIDLPNFLKDNPQIRRFFKSIKTFDKTNYTNWIWFDAKDLNYNDYLAAVKQNGYALRRVPEEFRDREMCLAAVKQDSSVLQFVPEQLKDREICLTAVKEWGYALQYVPKQLIDREMCLIAVKRNGLALEFVPEKLKDKEMCSIAVKQDSLALEFVPEKLKDKEICLAAVKRDGYALEFVPEKLKDKEICSIAKKWGYALQFIPKELRTQI